ncbi:SubName: Full=Uncharacterized protein {ECO:0000313/EMBL:CCA71612.1} [Serendipita indica DSM 11827]|uniref:F-box domain-containing protein n=1 Tax=Serendipita indica (strain DSM 11827) TaxID=1109443 RepID=G4TJW8_SERID|nr:SubName: Full=Uncharacterized protein {ECO:0000313/EMBL:CCA71612.1} [Serendipita indica DSM 11827]CCA71612.1 hypothetical protein PIIN_05548 [Serendipita indica DSM 11827]
MLSGDHEISYNPLLSIHGPPLRSVIDNLTVANWSPNRVPTNEERNMIRQLLDQDAQLLPHMEAHLKELSNSAEFKQHAAALRIQEDTLANQISHESDSRTPLVHNLPLTIDHISSKLPENGPGPEDARSALIPKEGQVSLDLYLEEKKKMKELTMLYELKRDVLSTRRLVPVEIWGEIFKLRMLEDHALYISRKRMGAPQFTALKLSAVCRHWRAIVAQFPVLWQYIAIPHHDKIMELQRDRILHYKSHLGVLLPKVYTYHHEIVVGVGVFPVYLLPFLRDTFGVDYASLEIANYTFSLLRGPDLTSFFDQLRPQTTHLTVYARETGAAWFFRPATARTLVEIPTYMLAKLHEVTGEGLGIRITASQPEINLSTLVVKDAIWQAADIQACFHVARHIERLELMRTGIGLQNAFRRVDASSLRFIICGANEYPILQNLLDSPNVSNVELTLRGRIEPYYWLQNSGFPLVSHTVKSLRLEGREFLERSFTIEIKIMEAILPNFPDITTLTLDHNMDACLEVIGTVLNPVTQLQNLRIVPGSIRESRLSSFLARYHLLHRRHVEVDFTERDAQSPSYDSRDESSELKFSWA